MAHIKTPRQIIGPATLHGDARKVKKALAGGADPNATYQKRRLLTLAYHSKNRALIKALLVAGADPSVLDLEHRDWTPSLLAFVKRTLSEIRTRRERDELDAETLHGMARPRASRL